MKYFAYYLNLRTEGLFNNYKNRNEMILANQKTGKCMSHAFEQVEKCPRRIQRYRSFVS